ncbi:MAG: hydratase, partial [Oscillospiraceae bacterium]|nr:hydratase [Oscillospiraceae bacterium]
MITLTHNGVFLPENKNITIAEARKNTIAYQILNTHNTSGNDEKLKIKFDAMASHDITYVGIIQTARASGLKEFPIPYVLTNCHNSLCAVGGTINEDDHMFGFSAAKKYGGIYVPAHQAVIHSYMRETISGCGKMILGSDSHTRYGALGTLAIGEGGPELVKQLLGRTYDINMPQVIAVKLTDTPKPGVGPQDVALAIIGAVYKNNFVKDKILEFIGDGIKNLPIEYRNGIDVMTTEMGCLSSIWETDEATEQYFINHGRPDAYKKLAPNGVAYYDGIIEVDLSQIKSMIALPFHPSNAVTIREFIDNPYKYFNKVKVIDSKIHVDQGIIAGCAGGTFDNLCAAADILRGKSVGNGAFSLSVYPGSQPVMSAILKNGVASDIINAGAILRTAFCGPCFGADNIPANDGFSIRHTTRNFENRDGSIPKDGQTSYVALMDARSVAATAINGGVLTPADSLDIDYSTPEYIYDDTAYRNRVFNGYGSPDDSVELILGPNITDWPEIKPLGEDMWMQVASVLLDPLTTTDELIPSGETSSYRSNPIKLAQFALSRKDPGYVARTKQAVNGSVIYAVKPGDGS